MCIRDSPYIVKGGVTSAMRDPYDLEIATGVSVRDGQIYLVDCPQDALPAEPRDDHLPPAVPPVGGGDDGEHIKSRKDLRKEALSLAHQAFHKPMNPECEYCGRGKKRHVASHSGRIRFPETVSYTHLTLPTICSV